MKNKSAAPNGATLHLNQRFPAIGKCNSSIRVYSSKFVWNVTSNGELIARFLTHRKAIAYAKECIPR